MKISGDTSDPSLARYAPQMRFEPIGQRGQKSLKYAQVVIIGCGGLGGVLAETLTRAGVGFLHLVDRDFIEIDNLQRQILFDEHDIAASLPKAEAAARKLRRVNSAVEIKPLVIDFNAANAEEICRDADLILDGTDNLQTRYLINDTAVKLDLPWVFGACAGGAGRVLPILPRETPCLRCIWREPPAGDEPPTAASAGMLAPIVNVIASLQATEVIKILTGNFDALQRSLIEVDIWDGQFQAIDLQTARRGDCPCCDHGKYDFLTAPLDPITPRRIGPATIQLPPPPEIKIDLKRIVIGLPSGSHPSHSRFLLRFRIDRLNVVIFADGRTIIRGTNDLEAARKLRDRFLPPAGEGEAPAEP